MAATTTVHVEAETTAGVETKEFLGYLWPVSLLKAYEKPVPKRLQSITHLGKKVRGAVLPDFVIGATEQPGRLPHLRTRTRTMSRPLLPWSKFFQHQLHHGRGCGQRQESQSQMTSIQYKGQSFRVRG